MDLIILSCGPLQVGLEGAIISGIDASEGVLSAFLELHGMQEGTMFFQLVGPPLELGIMWSKFNLFLLNWWPQ